MSNRRMLSIAALLLLASCAHTVPAPAPLVGTWVATSANAAGSSFEFRSDGSATWRLSQPFEIRYRLNSQTAPTHLDLSGFQTGPLEGRTLYCLVELAHDNLRMDCEPTAHPTSFDPDQTQVFTRQGGGA
jgi:hypothetical protein